MTLQTITPKSPESISSSPHVSKAVEEQEEEIELSSEKNLEDVVLGDHDDAKLEASSSEETPVMDPEDAGEEEWPQAFYCHRTHAVMTDPVVGPDGHSVERSAAIDNDEYYPNRALLAIMEETMALRNDTIRASLKSFSKSLSQGLCHLLPESATANEPLFRPLNDALYCPITFNLMHQPVIDPEGNTFEKVAVENWIRVNQNSPITRTELSIYQLYPNLAIQQLLQEEKAKPEQHMHPAVRKWKDEPMPRATDVELGGRLQQEQEQQQHRQSLEGVREPTIIVITASGAAYPTTPSEWVQREEARRRAMYNFFGIFFAGVCLLGFVLYGSIFFLLLFVMALLILFSKRHAASHYAT